MKRDDPHSGVVDAAGASGAASGPAADARARSGSASRFSRRLAARMRSRVFSRQWRAMALGALRRWDPFAFATLTARIVLINTIALLVLLGGVLIVKAFRDSLIEVRVEGLVNQANLLAAAVSDTATTQEYASNARQFLQSRRARRILIRLARSTGLRVQLYDLNGRLIVDTRNEEVSHAVERTTFQNPRPRDSFLTRLDDILKRALRLVDSPRELYVETTAEPISQDRVVYDALRGRNGAAERVNSEAEIIITVAVPVRRVRLVRGAIVLSTAGGDIDGILDEERRQVLGVFAVALIVLVLASFVLAGQIAIPIRRLAKAADSGAGPGPINPERIEIPDLTDRGDEIGNLSGALRRMTGALYLRIQAIENFAGDVAHEIKNPLTSLRSAVETLPLAKTDAERRPLLDVIQADVARMDRLVTDITNASRLDAELVRAERAPFDLRALLETVMSIAEGANERRRLRFALEAPGGGPLIMRGLEERLAQVFHNLLDNAVSFSPDGGLIRIVVASASVAGAEGYRIIVEDEGPGMPPEALERVFNRFYSQRPDGEAFGQHSGLGLNIARQIVEAHGGRIRADNRTDRTGATFSVDLRR